MFVLDTSVLIDVLRGDAAAVAWVDGLAEVPTCSEVTRAEVLRGVRAGERARTERLLHAVIWAPVDESVSRRAGDLGREYRRSHHGPSIADLIVAATALGLDAELATHNVRRFPMFDALRAPYGL